MIPFQLSTDTIIEQWSRCSDRREREKERERERERKKERKRRSRIDRATRRGDSFCGATQQNKNERITGSRTTLSHGSAVTPSGTRLENFRGSAAEYRSIRGRAVICREGKHDFRVYQCKAAKVVREAYNKSFRTPMRFAF